MKKALLITIMVLMVSGLSSQGLFKYKTTIEYKYRVSPVANLFGPLGKLKNLLGSGELIINYKLNRKLSLGLIGGLGTHKYNSSYSFFNSGGTKQTYEYELQFNKKTYGAQLNYYFKGNIAPLGSSLAFFYIADNYRVDDYNTFYAYLKSKESDDFQTDANIDYLIQYMGLEFNYIAMLSKKFPVYFKYGFSFAIPIHSQIIDFTVSEFGFKKYSDLSSNYQDYDFLSNFRRSRQFALNFGLGFLIR